MANKKISELTALTAPASTDILPIVDVSGGGTGSNNKITYANLLSKAPMELLPYHHLVLIPIQIQELVEDQIL